MDSKREKSWTIQSTLDLVKDLGPRENTARSYKLFKENLKKLRERGSQLSGPSGGWEPPVEVWEKQLKGVANDSLKLLVKLRDSRQLQLPSDRQNETHRKLLEAVRKFQGKMNLQEKQVALDQAYQEMRQRAYEPWIHKYNIPRPSSQWTQHRCQLSYPQPPP